MADHPPLVAYALWDLLVAVTVAAILLLPILEIVGFAWLVATRNNE
ncbi:MAG: hypothetical protein ABEJ28_07165 [Salinigranum sp.]